MGQILYETNTLEDKEHTLKIVNTGSNTQAVGLDAVAYLDNGGKGMVELEKDAYRVNEDTKYPIKLKRVGGTNGELTVQFEVAPGSAYQKHFDADGNKVTGWQTIENALYCFDKKGIMQKSRWITTDLSLIHI